MFKTLAIYTFMFTLCGRKLSSYKNNLIGCLGEQLFISNLQGHVRR